MKYAIPALFLSATAAAAHTGHDAALNGAAHWVLSPMHGLGLIAVAGLLYTLRSARQKE